LREAECEDDGLVHLVEEISGQPSIQAVAWVQLTAFCLVYSENQEQKAKQKDLKTCTLPRKEACVKLGPRKALLPKRLCPLKRSQVLCIRTVGKIP
jgi:hypothetical protein